MESIYPPEHSEMAASIAINGAVISEYPPSAKPRGGMFPQRNRLISGLSLGVCVMEAADRSGALITARLADEAGSRLFRASRPSQFPSFTRNQSTDTRRCCFDPICRRHPGVAGPALSAYSGTRPRRPTAPDASPWRNQPQRPRTIGAWGLSIRKVHRLTRCCQ